MANALYDLGRESFLKGGINWSTDTIKVTLVDLTLYTVSLSTHDFINDVPSGARVATGTLAGKTTVAGVADADDLTFPTVTGAQSGALIIWKDTGVEGTSQLIAYIDTATGLPVLPNGGDITCQWDSGSSKIFKL